MGDEFGRWCELGGGEREGGLVRDVKELTGRKAEQVR